MTSKLFTSFMLNHARFEVSSLGLRAKNCVLPGLQKKRTRKEKSKYLHLWKLHPTRMSPLVHGPRRGAGIMLWVGVTFPWKGAGQPGQLGSSDSYSGWGRSGRSWVKSFNVLVWASAVKSLTMASPRFNLFFMEMYREKPMSTVRFPFKLRSLWNEFDELSLFLLELNDSSYLCFSVTWIFEKWISLRFSVSSDEA